VRKALLLVAVAAFTAVLAGSANAASGTGGTSAPSPTTTTSGFNPDPGTTATVDPAKAPAGKTLIAAPGARVVSPRIVCATCTGTGEPVQGCATVYTNNGDSWGNWVRAYYHWCWFNGSISSNYGWGDEAACYAACNFLSWNYNFDFNYGHQDKGLFRDVSVGPLHYDSADATCVAVDGWGNAWGC
jgi:hypothetical protein